MKKTISSVFALGALCSIPVQVSANPPRFIECRINGKTETIIVRGPTCPSGTYLVRVL
jgi:hypothetical protein